MWNFCRGNLWPVLRETFRGWARNDGNLLAASMAYYAALSFFPLLMVLISAIGLAVQFSAGAQNAQEKFLELLAQNTSPVLADQIRTILSEIRLRAAWNGPLGLGILLLGAIRIFTHLTAAFDRIWGDSERPKQGITAAVEKAISYRLKAILLLLAVGLLVALAFSASVFLTAMRAFTARLPGGDLAWQALQLVSALGLNTVVFALLYKAVPKATVDWRDAIRGGLAVALVWEIGRQIVSLVIVRANYTAYGVVGAFIAMMLWVYFASALLFLGAQLVKVLRERRCPEGTK